MCNVSMTLELTAPSRITGHARSLSQCILLLYLQLRASSPLARMGTEETIAALKEWLYEEQYLPETSDDDLKLFAHCTENDVEAAKRLLDNFYTIRASAFDSLFKDRNIDSESLTNIRTLFQTFMGPKTTPEGYRILFSHALSVDTKLYDMLAQMKYMIMTLEASLVGDDPSPGHIVVFDISTLTAGHILKFSPSGIKKTSNYLQEGIPLKVQAIYLVNASPLVDIMMKTVKPFLNMDLLKRVNIFKSGELEKLYEHVPKDCLPEEYGGELGPSSIINDKNTNRLRELKEKFSQEEEILIRLKNQEHK